MTVESTTYATPTPIVTEPPGGAMMFSSNVVQSPEIPAFIPTDQAYYWSIPWQESERRALADLAVVACGRSRTRQTPCAIC